MRRNLSEFRLVMEAMSSVLKLCYTCCSSQECGKFKIIHRTRATSILFFAPFYDMLFAANSCEDEVSVTCQAFSEV